VSTIFHSGAVSANIEILRVFPIKWVQPPQKITLCIVRISCCGIKNPANLEQAATKLLQKTNLKVCTSTPSPAPPHELKQTEMYVRR